MRSLETKGINRTVYLYVGENQLLEFITRALFREQFIDCKLIRNDNLIALELKCGSFSSQDQNLRSCTGRGFFIDLLLGH